MRYMIAFLLLSSNCFAKLTNVEISALKSAISANEIEKFRAILKKSDSPFKAGFLDSDVSDTLLVGHDLVNFAVESKDCKDEFVEILIQFGGKPYKDFFLGTSNAAKQLCPKTIELILPFFEEKIQTQFGSSVISEVISVMDSAASGNNVSKVKLDNASAAILIFINKLKSKCAEYNVNDDWCLLKDGIAKMQKSAQENLLKIENEESRVAQSNSVEGISSQVCDLKEQILESEQAIRRQKEIGKTSGVVDNSVLHSKGARIVDLRHEISQLKLKLGSKSKNIKCKN